MRWSLPRGELLLDDSECQVWWARLEDARSWHQTLLNDVERERLSALRQQGDRDRFTVACALLRVAVAELLDGTPTEIQVGRSCDACGKPHGKPWLIGRPGGLELSLSHSGGRIALAVARLAPVGVDVEQVRDHLDVSGLARYALTPDERVGLAGLPSSERVPAFLTSWTRKESVLKATGAGLRVAASSFSVSAPHESPRLMEWPVDPRLVEVARLFDLRPGAGHVASLAVLGTHVRRAVELDGSALLARHRRAASPAGGLAQPRRP